MRKNIIDELLKKITTKYEDIDATIKIKKRGPETHVKMSGDAPTLLTLLTEAVANILSKSFDGDEFFIDLMADEICKSVKELAKGNNANGKDKH